VTEPTIDEHRIAERRDVDKPNGKFLQILIAFFIAILLGSFAYTAAIDNKKVDKREMDQFCVRLDKMDDKLDKIIAQSKSTNIDKLINLLEKDNKLKVKTSWKRQEDKP